MSDTDDTDDLLLIPPDFFVIDSELEPDKPSQVPYYSVFDSIITQVNNLSKRLDLIEYTSDLSLVNSSLDNLQADEDNYSSMYSSPKQLHSDYVPYAHRGTDTAQSTPQKPRTKFKLNSLPSSPSGARYSPRRSRTNLFAPKAADVNNAGDYKPVQSNNDVVAKVVKNKSDQEENNMILGEIDHFISNVRTIQRLNAIKNSSNTNMDTKNAELENATEQVQKRSIWNCGDDINTVPDYNTGMRDAMYGDIQKNKTKTEEPFVQQRLSTISASPVEQTPAPMNSDSFYTDDVSLSSSDSTQTTTLHKKHSDDLKKAASSEAIHSNALRTLDMHRKLLSRSVSPPNQRESEHERKEQGKTSDRTSSYNTVNVEESVDYIPPRIDDLRLFSLKDLWGTRDSARGNLRGGDSNYVLKLEEERLRRQVSVNAMYFISRSRKFYLLPLRT